LEFLFLALHNRKDIARRHKSLQPLAVLREFTLEFTLEFPNCLRLRISFSLPTFNSHFVGKDDMFQVLPVSQLVRRDLLHLAA